MVYSETFNVPIKSTNFKDDRCYIFFNWASDPNRAIVSANYNSTEAREAVMYLTTSNITTQIPEIYDAEYFCSVAS